jgi:hypothetical protein
MRERELEVVTEEPETPLDSSILAAMNDQVEEEPGTYSRNVFASGAGFTAVVAVSAFFKRGPRYVVAPTRETD